jgi:hypothetical protein
VVVHGGILYFAGMIGEKNTVVVKHALQLPASVNALPLPVIQYIRVFHAISIAHKGTSKNCPDRGETDALRMFIATFNAEGGFPEVNP